MRLTWFGHAAVGVRTAIDRIIIDPYRSPECGGYAPIDEEADIVICSHENDTYHSHLGQIRGEFEVVRALEIPAGRMRFEPFGPHIYALRVFETPDRRPEDEVAVVTLLADGFKLVHLGDLGHELTAAEIEPLRNADCLLVPAGGPPTIALDLIPPLLRALEPRLVMPVHYFLPGKIALPIRPADDLLALLAGEWPIERPGVSTIDLTPFPDRPRVVVLEPAR